MSTNGWDRDHEERELSGSEAAKDRSPRMTMQTAVPQPLTKIHDPLRLETMGDTGTMSAVAFKLAREKAILDGLGSSGNIVKYLNQDFEALKKQCLLSGTLFKDEKFPACPSSLGYKELGPYSSKTQGIIWKRPQELVPNPQFIEGGATRTDICQGALGDCWLLAAVASLTLNEAILEWFWQYGEWLDVIVDDRLPTKNGQLVFLYSKERNEFWGALLEKAYAKLNGSYEALIDGTLTEAFEDCTGGICESYNHNSAPPKLYQIIQKALQAGSLLGCFINTSEKVQKTSKQLFSRHAYSVTGAEEVTYRRCLEELIRIRNPWGECEWTGAWTTYWTNPQFKIKLEEPDDDQEASACEPCCTMIVGLMQKNRRRQKMKGEDWLKIGYCIYQPQVTGKDIDNEFKSLFEKLSGEDCELTANELQTILNRVITKRIDIKSDGFNINTCREMISLLDNHGTGTLGLVEFKILWMKIQKYLEIYKKVDTNYSGTIDAHEMRNALKEAGFTLSNKIQQSIIIRYACSKLAIDFDGFVACMIRLECLFSKYS
ncbi:Calpain-8, partial [Ophiophagus hannah]